MKATLISIGDEILIGQIVNTNAAWMAKQLNNIGINVFEVITISDTESHIQNALNHALKTSNIVLTTGGLGPTKDDITKIALARYFNTELILNTDILNDLEAYFAKKNIPLLNSIKQLAYMPANCKVLRNKKGLAAAMWFEENSKIVVAMPGVPFEMKEFMIGDVIPQLQQQFTLPTIIHRHINCAGIGESMVAEKIKHIETLLPEYIKLAYLPAMGILRLRLSGVHSNKQLLEKEIDSYSEQIVQTLTSKYVYSCTEEEPLAKTVGNLLIAQNSQLSVAESCTGGLIAHKITQVAGSSEFFMGSVVTYSNDLKIKLLLVNPNTLTLYGAVSEQTVIEMALGAIKHLGTNYAIAVSGIAGPSGATDTKPVGLMYIAVASPNNVVSKKFNFFNDRQLNIELATNAALNMLRNILIGNNIT